MIKNKKTISQSHTWSRRRNKKKLKIKTLLLAINSSFPSLGPN